MTTRLFDFSTIDKTLDVRARGKSLMTLPQLNKGTAFTNNERKQFCLLGKLPDIVESIEQQSIRAYYQYSQFKDPFEKFIYLNSLHNHNQTLFYHLLQNNLDEMLPIIYTPVISRGVEKFSQEFRSSRGIYISCNQIDSIDEILANRTNPDIDLIVVSDGQGILGIGDQGIGGLMIAVSKLAVYSVFGAINPLRTLPIILDVGTDNQHLIDDPLYLGVRSPRIEQDKYDSFIEQFVKSVKKNFPRAFLHWEDFGRNNAERILEKYQYQLCNFNDDSQGTGVVALGSILSGLQNQGRELKKSKIVIFGAGTAGIGIAKHIVASLVSMGLDKEQAYASIYLIDKDGLITDKSQDVTDQQRLFAKKMSACNLDEVISATRANILIGTSAAKGSFKQSTIKAMLLNDPRPMILILSNPSGRMEADPSDVIKWSNGSAQVACGSPYQNVVYNGQSIKIAQCNNFLSFPGIGMATVVVKPKYITTEMLLEASMTLSRLAQSQNSLLPDLSNYKSITINVAVSVARKAIEQGIATIDDFPDDLQSHVEKMIWRAEYMHYRAI